MRRNPIDTEGERDIDRLLQAYDDKIQTLRHLSQDLISSCSASVRAANFDFDDIFFLRYILSFGSPELAFPAVREATRFRTSNESWLGPAMHGEGVEQAPNRSVFSELVAVGQHSDKRTTDGNNIVHLVRSGISATHEVIAKLGVESVANYITYLNEHYYRLCDKATRTTRRLTKVLAINDLTGGNLLKIDIRFGKALGTSSKRGEYLHPQLVYRTVMFNPPGFFKKLFAAVKPFLSKGFVEKLSICSCPHGGWAGDIAQCPFVLKHFEPSDLPTFVGGECSCSGSCVPGWENDLSKDS